MDLLKLSLAGEFAVLSKLAIDGYTANMTLGNNKGVDILLYDSRNNKRMFKLEVKTTSNKKTSKSIIIKNNINHDSSLLWQRASNLKSFDDAFCNFFTKIYKPFFCFIHLAHSPQIFQYPIYRCYLLQLALQLVIVFLVYSAFS